MDKKRRMAFFSLGWCILVVGTVLLYKVQQNDFVIVKTYLWRGGEFLCMICLYLSGRKNRLPQMLKSKKNSFLSSFA